MEKSIFKRPSAFLPMLMSLVAVGIVFGHYAMYGITHEADEGTPAHLFQLLMAGQVPIVIFFGAKWLPLCTKRALQVLALQFGAALAAFASVYFFTGG